MKSSILYQRIRFAQNQPIHLKIVLLAAAIMSICALDDAHGQSIGNGSFVGLQDMKYSSREKHNTFKWYHLTRLTIKDDSVWVEQDPVAIHKQDTVWSASDGAFYYFEGTITTNGRQITMHLDMTDCGFCGIPEDSGRREQFIHRTWNGQMINDGMLIDGSFYSRSDHEAMRRRNLHIPDPGARTFSKPIQD